MRLLFLSNEFPNLCEPTKATFNGDLLTALASSHEVTVISPISWWVELRTRSKRPWQPWPRTRQLGPLLVHHPRFYYTPGRMRHWYGDFLWWSLRGTVSRILRRPRPDGVLSYWAHPDGEAAVRLAQALEVPSVVMVGGSDVLLLTRDPRRQHLIRRVLQQADAVVAVSRDLAARIAAMGIPPQRIHVLRRGVDENLFFPGDRAQARRQLGLPASQPLLLWVGRMVPVKGLDTLLAACERLKDQTPDYRLYLIGDGPLRPSLAAEAQQRGLAEHVTFVGTVAHEHLGPWFQAADLTVLPSRSEGVPNILLESLACGTPFVASEVGGVPEISNHAAARLVPPDRPDLLAAALQTALAEQPVVAEADRPQTLQQFAGQVAELFRGLQSPTGATPENKPASSRSAVPTENAPNPDASPDGPGDAPKPNQSVVPSVRKNPWRQWALYGLTQVIPKRRLLVRGDTRSCTAYLTFDDGPDPEETPRVLEVLHRYDAKATFFVIGRKAEMHPDLVRQIIDQGHIIGNHTFFHRPDGWVSSRQFIKELRRTDQVLQRILGRSFRLVRPPYGKLTVGKLWRLWADRWTIVLWNYDPKDFAARSADQLAAWFREHPLAGGDIILLHDTSAHTARALEQVIPRAQDAGLVFAPVA